LFKIVFSLSVIFINLFAISNNFFNANKEGWFFYKEDNSTKQQKNKQAKNKIVSKKKKVLTQVNEHDFARTKRLLDMHFETDEERQERIKKEDKFIDNIDYNNLRKYSVDEFRQMFEAVRGIAWERPTKKNLAAFTKLNKYMVDNSYLFAKVFTIVNKENPNHLDWSAPNTFKYKRVKDRKDNINFLKKLKNNLAFLVVVEDINDKSVVYPIAQIYKEVTRKTGIEVRFASYYDIPNLVDELSIDKRFLPIHLFVYIDKYHQKQYRKFLTGFGTPQTIINDSVFIFKNTILEKTKLFKAELDE